MWEHIKSFHFALKDRNLHIILYTAIVILASWSAYEQFSYKPPDPYTEVLLSKISQFDIEHNLQDKPEKIDAGSIKVPILIYHSVRPHTSGESDMQKQYDVSPDAFEEQLRYLKEHGYVVISLTYLVDALEESITLPEKSVVITFDDGWRNQYAYAFPVLKKYADTATFFIVSDYVGGGYFLTWDQIRVMNNSGMVIGAHTRTHPLLVNVPDLATLRSEIKGSKDIIEGQVGEPVTLFAYPYGHYDDRIIQVVKDAGFKSARSTYSGVHHSKKDLFTLKGVEVTDDMSAFVRAIQ